MKSDGAPSRAPSSHAPSSCRPTCAPSAASTTPSSSPPTSASDSPSKIRERAVRVRHRRGVGARDRPHQHLSRDGDRDAPRAVARSASRPTTCSSTASRSARSAIAHTAIVGGDDACYTIACASIIAKVTRDRLMRALAGRHPNYLWERNVGYVDAGALAGLGGARRDAAPSALVHAGAPADARPMSGRSIDDVDITDDPHFVGD